ncbi:hypothetical protein F5050DRAFT_1899841 [Lentinula boryana]|uniref:Uncharacterized protein n=1 Tax=Lentinula boryana TaxID=40481 RepID=A0ABQ8QQZ5_9AGAR|nr:hypothetical protein F5050DRAFT_1899841 [Lentinula boryana]
MVIDTWPEKKCFVNVVRLGVCRGRNKTVSRLHPEPGRSSYVESTFAWFLRIKKAPRSARISSFRKGLSKKVYREGSDFRLGIVGLLTYPAFRAFFCCRDKDQSSSKNEGGPDIRSLPSEGLGEVFSRRVIDPSDQPKGKCILDVPLWLSEALTMIIHSFINLRRSPASSPVKSIIIPVTVQFRPTLVKGLLSWRSDRREAEFEGEYPVSGT